MPRAVWLLVVALLAGCAGDPEPPAGPVEVEVGPPTVTAGGFAECAPPGAILTSLPTNARVATDTQGLGPGIHRLDNETLLFVWASYESTLREDRITRLNEVQAWRAADGAHSICTRVEIAAPATVAESEPRSYDVGAFLVAEGGYPATRLDVVVNWVAGCRCDPVPRGNTTATFDAPTVVPQTQ